MNRLFTKLILILSSLLEGNNFKIICVIPNWSYDYKFNAEYNPRFFVNKDLDPFLCTDILYGFATIDENELVLKPRNDDLDIKQNLYFYTTNLKTKNPKLRVLLETSVNDESILINGSNRYQKLVNNEINRKNFIEHLIPFLNKYNFDGIDINWRYPNCPFGYCGETDKIDENEKKNFATFISEIKDAFDSEYIKRQRKLYLSASFSENEKIIKRAYDLQRISKNIDYMIVLTYQYDYLFPNKVTHMSPFKSNIAGKREDSEFSMSVYESNILPEHKSKLMLTIAGYGRTYRLKNVKNHSIGDEAIGRGNGSKYIKNEYNIPFYEVCDRIKNQNWIKERNNNEGPFAYKEDQWMSFDDELSALNKAMFVREKGYGGLVIWDITQDDFRGKCANSVFPLVNAVKNGLKVTEKGSNDLYFIIVLIVILPLAIIIGIIIGIFIGFKLQSLRSKKRTVVNDNRQTESQFYDQIELIPQYLEIK